MFGLCTIYMYYVLCFNLVGVSASFLSSAPVALLVVSVQFDHMLHEIPKTLNNNQMNNLHHYDDDDASIMMMMMLTKRRREHCCSKEC